MAIENIRCPICGNDCTKDSHTDGTIFKCVQCGRFNMDTFVNEPQLTEHHRLVLRHYFTVLPDQDEKRLKVITNSNINEIVESINYPKNLLEKIDRVLSYFVNLTDIFGQKIRLNEISKVVRLLFCSNEMEFRSILDYLHEKKYIIRIASAPAIALETYQVQTEGLQYYYNNVVPKSKFNQCFVAMWFNDSEDPATFKPNMQHVYTSTIKPAIENSGKYTSIKIDNLEYCNDINDEMIAQIRKSKFMIADLTGYRGGVYWEAGFAEGLGIPVIYTCHKQWLKSNSDLNIEGVHFDINHKNIILWDDENLSKFNKDLVNRIDAVIV